MAERVLTRSKNQLGERQDKACNDISIEGPFYLNFAIKFESKICPFHIRKRLGTKLVTDPKERDKVLKQSFSADRVPSGLDAIVIGSGIGGLTTAALLAKVGKKVLVLEQHDQVTSLYLTVYCVCLLLQIKSVQLIVLFCETALEMYKCRSSAMYLVSRFAVNSLMINFTMH